MPSRNIAPIASDADYERRSEERRTDVVERAIITFRGKNYAVSVINISSRGAQVECDIVARLGESILVQFENCSRIYGFVRWMRDGKIGIRFGHEIILVG
jgi:hypothetical protein